ncbi:hypothetical protein HDU91_002221 [Kappamyces sp. JEL0680]|nr:hypothetical protein HDU91_002221 [Kappamyces sp. JEL0680]
MQSKNEMGKNDFSKSSDAGTQPLGGSPPPSQSGLSFDTIKKKFKGSKAGAKKHRMQKRIQNLRIWAMRVAVNFVVFALYVPTGIYLYAYFVVNESIPTNYAGLYIAKNFIDAYAWFCCSFYAGCTSAALTVDLWFRLLPPEHFIRQMSSQISSALSSRARSPGASQVARDDAELKTAKAARAPVHSQKQRITTLHATSHTQQSRHEPETDPAGDK